jgi:hypothetical protein
MTNEPTPPPRLVLIFGPAAVGKMTVGQELAKATGLTLLYNHQVVDLVTELFPFGTPMFHRLSRSFTLQMLEAAAESRMGLILTHGLVFSRPSARMIIDDWSAPCLNAGGDVYYVELTAPLECRLIRNETENRQRHKKTDWATPERLREMETWGRWNSDGDFPYRDRHIVIDNSNLEPRDVAHTIRQRFDLPVAADTA